MALAVVGALVLGFIAAVAVGTAGRVGELEERVKVLATIVDAMLKLPEMTCDHGVLRSLECLECARESADL